MCMLVAMAILVMSSASLADSANSGEISVQLSVAQNGVQTPDPEGAVDRALLTVTNDGAAPVVGIRVDFPPTMSAASYQDAPPAGWVMDVQGHAKGRDYIVYTGILGLGQSVGFHLRTIGLDIPAEPKFTVSFRALPGVAVSHPEPLDVKPSLATDVSPVCIQIPLSTAFTTDLYVPVGAVTEETSASVLTVKYDLKHRTFLDTTVAAGDLVVTSPLTAEEKTFSNVDTHFLGLVDTPTGPVLTPAVEGQATIEVSKTTLWSGEGPDAKWFVSKPGRYLITSTVDCAPMAFMVVPPGDDSDLDGFVNINELRSNANPLVADSTPYSDDDGDNIPNGRDPVNTWMI